MRLSILLPDGVFLEQAVDKIIAESEQGFFCLLPHHIDFVTALAPGLFSYVPAGGAPELLALDAGTLVKRGDSVRVAVRRAIRASEPGRLARTVADGFRRLAAEEREARNAAAHLETDLMRRFLVLRQSAGLPAGGELW